MSDSKLVNGRPIFSIVGDVDVAYLHSPTMIPGILLTLESTLNDQKAKGVRVQLTTEGGLVLSKGNVYAYIPAAAVKVAVLKNAK